MLTMYDSVTAENIPASARAVVAYIDGRYANLTAIRDRFPWALVLTITVEGNDADACDCETGDLTAEQAVAWVRRRLEAGADRPVVYANADRWADEGLREALASFGTRIRRWVAAYNDQAEIPAGFDAHQFHNDARIDISVCSDQFFAAEPVPVVKPVKVAPVRPSGKARFTGTVDLATGQVTVRGLPGLGAHFAGQGHRLEVGVTARGTWYGQSVR